MAPSIAPVSLVFLQAAAAHGAILFLLAFAALKIVENRDHIGRFATPVFLGLLFGLVSCPFPHSGMPSVYATESLRGIFLLYATLYGGPFAGITAGIAATALQALSIGAISAAEILSITTTIVAGILILRRWSFSVTHQQIVAFLFFGLIVAVIDIGWRAAFAGMSGVIATESLSGAHINFLVLPSASLVLGYVFHVGRTAHHTQDSLRARERRYRTIIDTAREGFWATDENLNTTDVNEALCKLLGYSRDALMTISPPDVVDPSDRATLDEQIRKRTETDDRSFEIGFLNSAGNRVDVRVNATTLRDENGRAKGSFAFYTDVSEERNLRNILIQSEERVRSLLMSIGEGTFGVNLEGICTFINPAAVQMLGFQSMRDLLGVSMHPLIHHTTQDGRPCPEESCELMLAISEGQNLFSDSEYFWRGDGRRIPVELRIHPVHHDGELDGAVVTFADISARKRAEQELKTSERRLRSILEAAHDAVLTCDMNFTVRGANPAAERIFGAPRAAMLGHHAPDLFVPEHLRNDFSAWVRRLESVRNRRILGKWIETTACRWDGSEFPIELSINIVRTREGVEYSAFIHDITDRKKYEKTLAESERRANEARHRLTQAISAISEGFMIFDREDRLVVFNDQIKRLFPRLGDILHLGITFEDTLRRNAEQGAFVIGDENEEAWIQERLERHRHPSNVQIVRTAENRWIRVSEHRTSDGEYVGTRTDVTELVEREKALQRSEGKYRALFDSANDAIVIVAEDGDIAEANVAACRLFECGKTDLIGSPAARFITYTSSTFHEDGNGLRATDPDTIVECRCRTQTKREIVAEMRVGTVDIDGVPHHMAILRDVTERRAAERRVRILSRAVEQSPAMVVITDADGVIEYINPKLARISGFTFEDVVGNTARIFKSGLTSDETYQDLWRTILSGREWSGVMENKKKDGETYWVSLLISPITDDAGKVLSFIGVSEDITERIEMEKHQRQTQKLEALGSLAGGIAHDFNNMLLPIVGLTSLTLKSLPEGSSERKCLEKVVQAAERARELIRRILAFSREEEPEKTAIDVNELLEECLTLIRPAIPSTIRIDTEFELAIGHVLVDIAQFHTILMNLASNAAHAIGSKPGILGISLRRADAGNSEYRLPRNLEGGAFAVIAVSDTGDGMEEKILGRIFDPFFTTKPVGEGTGLGLSVVHGIIAAHKGAITAQSVVGEGSTFTIYLPIREVSQLTATNDERSETSDTPPVAS